MSQQGDNASVKSPDQQSQRSHSPAEKSDPREEKFEDKPPQHRDDRVAARRDARFSDDLKVCVNGVGMLSAGVVKEFFSQCGEVVDLYFGNSPEGSFAFVGFPTKECVDEALKLDGVSVQDHTLKITLKSARKGARLSDDLKVCVKGVGLLSADVVKNFFSKCGDVVDLYLGNCVDGNFAYVGFPTKESVDEALKLDGASLRDHTLKITLKTAWNDNSRSNRGGERGRGRDRYEPRRYGGRDRDGGYGRDRDYDRDRGFRPRDRGPGERGRRDYGDRDRDRRQFSDRDRGYDRGVGSRRERSRSRSPYRRDRSRSFERRPEKRRRYN